MTEADQMVPSPDLAKAGMGAFMLAKSDGSLGTLDSLEAFDIINSAVQDPGVLTEDLGFPRESAMFVDPVATRENMLNEYYSASAEASYSSLSEALDRDAEATERAGRDAVYTYAGMSPDDIARLEFDESSGDDSAWRAAQAKYYLG